MNTRINLDLGISAAETMSPEELQSLKGDFEKINGVLASLVGSVLKELAEIWRLMGLLNPYLGSVENAIISFSMGKARDAAWSFAETLSPLSEEQRQMAIMEKDEVIAIFAMWILG